MWVQGYFSMSRTRTYLFLVIIILLLGAGTVTGADTLTRTDFRQLTTAATSTPVPAPPAAMVTCISPCLCLEYSRAVTLWGTSSGAAPAIQNFLKTINHPAHLYQSGDSPGKTARQVTYSAVFGV
jgi:hypothetical protein